MGQIREGNKTVLLAGIIVRLVNVSTPAKWLHIQDSNPSPTSIAVVGGATVVAAAATRRGITIDSGSTYERQGVRIPGPLNLNDLWLDSTGNSKVVEFLYEEP